MPHESSDGYSDGQRQMALGLEVLKFARAVGEGETPSTLIETEKTAADVGLPVPSEEMGAEVTNAHAGGAAEGSSASSHSHATQVLDAVSVNIPITTHIPATTIGVSSNSLPATVSERAAKNIMDQSGGFDIVTPPISAISALRGPQRTGIPTMTPPFSLIPPTPPQASETDVGTTAGRSSVENTMYALRPPQSVTRAPHSAPPALEADASSTSNEMHVVETKAKTPAGASVSSGTATNTTTHTTANEEKPFANVRVLVVDDDPLTRTLMTRMLQRLGCTVTLAENGRIALEKILGGALPPRLAASVPNLQNLDTTSFMPQREQAIGENRSNDISGEKNLNSKAHVYLFDVVFLDNQMPVMSGLDTVAALRTLGREDLVVGVTGNALASDQQEYLDKGVDR